jgi:hypothetical protein
MADRKLHGHTDHIASFGMMSASVAWALVVWLFGEAAGGLFSPGASALTGAPGAALLYALLSVLVWPPRHEDAPVGRAVRRLPELAWSALWLGTAALELEVLNRSGFIVGATISTVAYSAPGAFAGADRAVSGYALGIWLPRARRLTLTLVLAITAAALFGVVGQNLGAIFSNGFTGLLESGATDPGSGPLLVLIALALWPSVGRALAVSPAPVDRPVTRAARVRRHITTIVGLSPNLASDELPPDVPHDGCRQTESRPTRLVSV